MPTTELNCGFAWFLTVLSMAGYFYFVRKRGEKWAFWPMLAASWLMFALSHSLLLAAPYTKDEWYMMFLRVLGYVLAIGALLSLMAKPEEVEKPQGKKG